MDVLQVINRIWHIVIDCSNIITLFFECSSLQSLPGRRVADCPWGELADILSHQPEDGVFVGELVHLVDCREEGLELLVGYHVLVVLAKVVDLASLDLPNMAQS